ncbi:MAG: 1-acyl-sn-glycerol-3-phosphate acyltransferase [Alphaproteobacteria bacterium]|nr:1-acyl-sn-glycerol-3-phosphate acyltransferase [Alphaproteobacteria bacterium]
MGVIAHDQTRPFGGRWSIGRIWRLIATGLSFALFGIGGLVLALIWIPVINLIVWNSRKRAALAQLSVHKVWRLYIEVMRLLGVLTYEVENVETLRKARGTVVISNHPSLLDVVFMMAFMRRTRAVVKRAVWNNPFMAGAVRSANYIPNLDDPEALIAACAEALKDGANLCIFPEGSRTQIGANKKYQRGFAYVALEAGAPILLVTIQVTPPTLRKGEPWYSIPTSKPHWHIRVRDTIDTPASYGRQRTIKTVRALATDMQRKIQEEFLK